MSPTDFNWRVIDAIEKLIDKSGLTRAEVIARSGMRRNTFFVKMRGETALTTDDVSKLSDALGVEPEVIFAGAANVPASREDIDVRKPRQIYGLAAETGEKAIDQPHAD